LPGMVLLGLGAGIALNPMLLVAMSDVEPSQSGMASGVVNTAFMMGGALDLAVLAGIAAAVTSSQVGLGVEASQALNAGYQLAFKVGAAFAAIAGFIGFAMLKKATKSVEK
jgi:MFS family permease